MTQKLKTLRELTEKFRGNLSQYTDKTYKEQRLRMDFVDAFFELLDWDLSNKQGAIEEFRDVVIEDNLEISGTQKYPDYTFRIGNEPVFFVETKKPAINLKEAIDPAQQVRRYGYSAKRNISILTDFEEFAIYDTRVKPGKNDQASVARLFYCTFEDYEKNWDFLSGLLAKNAVKKGSINNYVGKGTKRGTSEVDKDFLRLIEHWRGALAKNIARNNKRTNLDGINLAVQKIIDRTIFLRICEEKGIEQFENLRNIGEDKAVYEKLARYFDKANKKYNSELFKPDDFVNGLKIDDDVLRDIIKDIYYPECPYAFSVLPVEILGNIYEQFLGKTIHLTESRQARIVEKPEVRKAGGVYYTPKYIVDYIVKNTVGEKIKGLTPKKIEKIKILDPACGSGSFLLGAYTYLLNYHLVYYTKKENLAKALKNKLVYPSKKDSYKLTIKEKQGILLNNVFGVDIDGQAVEVTKLSLMLKLLEGESDESAGMLFKYSETKLLPTLSDNIKCGNSLIGPDFYKDKNLSLFGNEEMKKINVFDWQKEFSGIFKAGGFDCVIGNPPYINLANLPEKERMYFQKSYYSCKNKSDLYSFFIEKCMAVSKVHSRKLGFIVPHTWLATDSFVRFRGLLFKTQSLEKLVEMGFGVFDKVVVSTLVVILSDDNKNIAVLNSDFTGRFSILTSAWAKPPFHIDLNYNLEKQNIYDKMEQDSVPLSQILQFSRGIKTSDDSRFLSFNKKGKEYIKVYRGRNIKAYQLNWDGEYVWYRPDLMKEKVGSLPHSSGFFGVPEKLITQRVNSSMQLLVAYDNNQNYFLDTTNVSRYASWDKIHSIKYLCGIMNSKLINYWYCNKYKMPTIGLYELHVIPIKKIDFSDIKLKRMHNGLEALVDQMLETQKKYHSAKSESDKKHYQQKIEILDKQIDELVYELYGLTKKEIRVVEGNRNEI
ncbi:MAG: TaqI-like C-terminal specificity domain-containing protein [bacterium]